MATRTPMLQPEASFHRDWGNFATLEDCPNAVNAPLGDPEWSKLQPGDTAFVATVAKRVFCASQGAIGTGDAVWLTDQVSFRLDTIERSVEVDGQRAYFLPWGTYVRANQNDMRVEWAKDGVNFSPLAFGTEWIFQSRQAKGTVPWSQPSTADVSTGAWLLFDPPAGAIVRLTWRTGEINIAAPEPVIVHTRDGKLDPDPANWRFNNPKFLPNGVVIAEREGLQIEMWRFCSKQGHASIARGVPPLVAYRGGRRFTPYYRLDLSKKNGDRVIDFATLPLPHTPRFWVMRWCYYEPQTGARSRLSEIQTRWIRNRDERIEGAPVHTTGSAWTTRG